jgi:hypothetical protein
MEEKLATDLSDQIIIFNSKLSMIIGEMKLALNEEEYSQYLKKLSHMMALSFDVLDMLGNKYPHLNPYEHGGNA